jgi:hypothetical protein
LCVALRKTSLHVFEQARTTAHISAMLAFPRRRRFRRVNRSRVPDNSHSCRSCELEGERLAAHQALMATFDSRHQAKARMTTTVATIFGDAAWESRNEAELIATQRLFSSGSVSLEDTLDAAFDAYGANDESMPFFDSMGGALEAAGLVQVKDDVLVDGWRLEAARASLREQGYSNESPAMRSLAIENILVVWLNYVLSDPVLKERIPCFVCVCRVQKSHERLVLTPPTPRRWAHCFWGAFGNVAPELFVGLFDALWASRAGDTLVLPCAADEAAGEVAAGPLVVLEAAAAAVPVGSPAASLIADALGRQRAADLYFSKERRVPGERRPRVILPSDKSDAAKEVRKAYRKALVAKALADQFRRDLIKDGGDRSRLRAYEAELAADARAAVAAPASVPAAAAAAALRRVTTRECVRAACACVKTIDAPSTRHRRWICFYAGVRDDLPVRHGPRDGGRARRRRGSRKGTAGGVPRVPCDAGTGLRRGRLCARRAVYLGRRPRHVRCLRDPNSCG